MKDLKRALSKRRNQRVMLNRQRIVLIAVGISFILSLIIFYQNVIKYKPIYVATQKGEAEKSEKTFQEPKKVSVEQSLLEKNLFNPDRTYVEKAEEEEKTEEVTEPKQMPQLQLKGIVLNQYDEYVAIISINNKKPVMLRVGEKVEDIEVVEISDRAVELNWLGEPITLTMDKIKTLEEKR